jgi:hypothetical protein
MKGTPGPQYTITMLGGTVGDHKTKVADAPTFKIGDHDILFVEHNGEQFIPLVANLYVRGDLHIKIAWQRVRESNPCTSLERAVS